MPYALGAHRSPPDHRDFAVAAFLPANTAALPDVLDLRQYLQAVRDQGQEGTCAAHAGASGIGGWEEQQAHLARTLSTRWLYEHARARQAPPDGAEGAYLRCIMAAMLDPGTCLEADNPYVPGSPTQPGPQAASHAAQNRIGSYAAVGLDPASIKASLYYHGPVAVAADVDDGFVSPNATHVIVAGGQPHGGHAFCLVGYDNSRQLWLVRNSWGTTWGDEGYAWLPWSYPLWEAWTATPALVDGSPPPAPVQPWWVRLLHQFGIG